MAQSGGGGGGGGIAATRAKLSSSSAGAGALEDRLSALPDDVLVLILLRLGTTAEAVRTSVLSRRWPRVWHLLPKLVFERAPDGHRIREVLVAPDAPPPLRSISVCIYSITDTLGAWLPDAARRLSGDLFYYNFTEKEEEEEEEDEEGEGNEDQAGETGVIQLPCFENATGIFLRLGNLGLSLPFAGTFACLVKLSLGCIRLHGSCELGDVVSQRCPSLQSLMVNNASGVDKLTIHSESLLQVDLGCLNGLRQLTVVAPGLKGLKLYKSFVHNQPVADISAPQLVLLEWRDSYDPSSVHLGNFGQLQMLSTDDVFVYCEHDSEHNSGILKLMQQFQSVQTLSFTLFYPWDIGDYQYSMEYITMLPPTTFLKMGVKHEEHDFGPSTFHVLRRCAGIRRLELVLHGGGFEYSACQSGCNCDQPTDWKAEELSLNCLEEVELTGLKGADHEVVFVERLFSWATVLKKIRVTFHYSVSKSKAREILAREAILDHGEFPFFVLYSECQLGCNCDQPTDWKPEELSLNCLEEVELYKLKGADHEVVFAERLFRWATVLKKVRVTFHYSVSKSKAREILQTLSSFSRSETLVEFYMFHDNLMSTYLLAPEAKESSLITD